MLKFTDLGLASVKLNVFVLKSDSLSLTTFLLDIPVHKHRVIHNELIMTALRECYTTTYYPRVMSCSKGLSSSDVIT